MKLKYLIRLLLTKNIKYFTRQVVLHDIITQLILVRHLVLVTESTYYVSQNQITSRKKKKKSVIVLFFFLHKYNPVIQRAESKRDVKGFQCVIPLWVPLIFVKKLSLIFSTILSLNNWLEYLFYTYMFFVKIYLKR